MKFVVTVRGKLKGAGSKADQDAHNATVDRLSAISKSLGATGHQAYLNPQSPGEFLAVDSWGSMEGLQKFMGDAANPGAQIASLFDGQPDITVWAEAEAWRAF